MRPENVTPLAAPAAAEAIVVAGPSADAMGSDRYKEIIAQTLHRDEQVAEAEVLRLHERTFAAQLTTGACRVGDGAYAAPPAAAPAGGPRTSSLFNRGSSAACDGAVAARACGRRSGGGGGGVVGHGGLVGYVVGL